MASADPNSVVIKSNGQSYTAWQSITVHREYANAISIFEFVAVEGAYGTNYTDLKLKPGDKVQIYLAGQLALTGFVTTRLVAYDGQTHQVVISGASLSANLAKASIPVKPGNYNGSTFEQATQAVLQGTGVSLQLVGGDSNAQKPFASLCVQYGETRAEFIGRIALARGLFLSDDVNGNLVATGQRPSSSGAISFVEGQNILRATAKMDNQGYVGKYTGVSATPGNDQHWPTRAYSASVTQSAGDPNEMRLFVAEHPMDADELTSRVQLEAARSAWPAFSCSVTTNGWTAPNGQLYNPGTMDATVISPMLFPTSSGKVLCGIQAATFTQDDKGGSTTVLEMTLPELLSSHPAAGVADVGGANVSSNAATPDAPDYTVST